MRRLSNVTVVLVFENYKTNTFFFVDVGLHFESFTILMQEINRVTFVD